MITYRPAKILKRVAPRRRVEKLLTDRLSINRAILGMLSDMDVVSREELSGVALRTAAQYRKRVREEVKAGASKSEAKEEVVGSKDLLVNRIQNAVVQEIAQGIRDEYQGEQYVWLPSDAEEPDPEHQLNYGKIFTVGDGEMPGDRYGCRCGMQILTPEEKLQLGGAA